MEWIDYFCQLSIVGLQCIAGIIFCITEIAIILILTIFLIACAIELILVIYRQLMKVIKIFKTNGNMIRRMNNRQMAEYFLQNYQKIGQYKGRFCGVSELEKWLNTVEE